jgi:D-alanyl-D-alanine carboxypeptidase (penicillin-binding protein 5/6)
MRKLMPLLLALLALPGMQGALPTMAGNPYQGAIVIDATSGKVLFEDHADTQGYPASVTKLMTFLVVMEQVDFGNLKLDTPVTVSAYASHIGGSRVFLKDKEVFTIDDLLGALMIQSANDAAVALAETVAGSEEAFVVLMNEEAKKLGLTHTVYHSPHGLPPGRGQEPDVSTARDLATLSRELIRRGDILRYSSVRQKTLRAGTDKPFVMTNHNHLLGHLPGCDGLKTGYYREAGYTLSATSYRDGNRVITVVLGCDDRRLRDAKVAELTQRGFVALPPSSGGAKAVPPPPASASRAAPAAGQPADPNAPPVVQFKLSQRPVSP